MANEPIHIYQIQNELQQNDIDGSEFFVVSNIDQSGHKSNKVNMATLKNYVRSGDGGQSGGASILEVYPVGSVYITVDPTFDPNGTWGGTWVLIGAGRCLWGTDQDSLVGTELNGIMPNHTHSCTSYEFSTGTVDTGTGMHPLYSANERSNNTGLPVFSYGVANMSTGTTLRPPSIGVKFWKRTA